MTKEYAIPLAIQCKISDRVNVFNEKNIKGDFGAYVPLIRGKYIYLTRQQSDGSFEKICRLSYEPDLQNMEFAIFRFSAERYDTDALFPGDEHLDGTLEGAMRAALEAYPI